MTYVINAYLKRHDTYSRFEFAPGNDGAASDRVVRHAIDNPADQVLVLPWE